MSERAFETSQPTENEEAHLHENEEKKNNMIMCYEQLRATNA